MSDERELIEEEERELIEEEEADVEGHMLIEGEKGFAESGDEKGLLEGGDYVDGG